MPPGEPVLASTVPTPWLKGRYHVARLLGKGAQARVYVAYDTRLRLWRAIKVLAPAFVDDRDVRARFEQEAQAMARLTHPNLVRVVDVDHDQDLPFLVMELAPGGAITAWIQRHGPLPPHLAARVVGSLCDGLAHAHAAGVVHRDVKPHNVLIRADGEVVLSDFGIARVTLDGPSLTATGTVLGSFAFMAPEQRTDSKSVDPRADVYALGATLFSLVTGKTSAELFFAEAKDAILREIPDLLRPVILTACRYDREERYGTTLELKDALEVRVQRLESDPPCAPLNDRLLDLPSEPPTAADPDAGLEELCGQLYRASAPPAALHPPPLQVITPRPSLGRREPAPLSIATLPTPPNARPSARFRIASTLTGPHGTYTDPDPPALPRPFQIDLDGARSLSTEHAPEPVSFVLRPSRTAIALAFVLAALLSTMSIGMANKIVARQQCEQAQNGLLQAVNDGRAVVAALDEQGADTTALVAQLARTDQAGATRADEAALFVRMVQHGANNRDLPEMARGQVVQLTKALRRWETASAHREHVRASWLSRMTGEIGL